MLKVLSSSVKNSLGVEWIRMSLLMTRTIEHYSLHRNVAIADYSNSQTYQHRRNTSECTSLYQIRFTWTGEISIIVEDFQEVKFVRPLLSVLVVLRTTFIGEFIARDKIIPWSLISKLCSPNAIKINSNSKHVTPVFFI